METGTESDGARARGEAPHVPNYTKPGHGGLHYGLSSLANHAAIELESLRRSKPIGLDSVRRLTSFLEESASAWSVRRADHCVVYPDAAIVLNRAISSSSPPDMSPVTLQDLSERIHAIRNDLQTIIDSFATGREIPNIDQIVPPVRVFCTILSSTARNYEASLNYESSGLPYRF